MKNKTKQTENPYQPNSHLFMQSYFSVEKIYLLLWHKISCPVTIGHTQTTKAPDGI